MMSVAWHAEKSRGACADARHLYVVTVAWRVRLLRGLQDVRELRAAAECGKLVTWIWRLSPRVVRVRYIRCWRCDLRVAEPWMVK